jgi:hypothetical protein
MNKNQYDDSCEHELSIWVSTVKSHEEFVEALEKIIYPVPILNGKFSVGGIEAEIKDVKEQPPSYLGVPSPAYSYVIVIASTPYLIWGAIDKRFVYALTLGLRTKFLCKYLVTAEPNFFVMYSGSHEPYYINLNYPACANGELIGVSKSGNVELRI